MFKTWAHPTTKLSTDWVGYKIPPTELKRDIIRALDGEQMDDMWGHSSSFKYPKKTGLGGIWRMIAKRLPRNNVKFRAEVVQINLEERMAKTRDDIEIKYKVMYRFNNTPFYNYYLEFDINHAFIDTFGFMW